MTAYILTAAAEADIRGIVRYTRKQWGDAQVRRYVAVLEQALPTSPPEASPLRT